MDLEKTEEPQRARRCESARVRVGRGKGERGRGIDGACACVCARGGRREEGGTPTKEKLAQVSAASIMYGVRDGLGPVPSGWD